MGRSLLLTEFPFGFLCLNLNNKHTTNLGNRGEPHPKIKAPKSKKRNPRKQGMQRTEKNYEL